MKATQQLHDLGQSLWLDNITRDLLDERHAQALHRRAVGHRAHLEPDDLRPRHQEQHGLRRGHPRRTGAGQIRRGAVLRAGARGPHARRRSVPAGPRTDQRRRRLGLAGGVAAAGLRHGEHASPPPRICTRARRGPTCSSRFPGTKEGLARDRGGDLRRRADQRDAAVFARAVPGRGRGLPARHRAAHRRRARIPTSPRSLRCSSAAGTWRSRGKVPAALRNQLGIAIAQRTYKAYRELLAFAALAARLQRRRAPAAPAVGQHRDEGSEGVRHALLKALAAPFTVNTMPEATLKALADHGEIGAVLARRGGRGRPARAFAVAGGRRRRARGASAEQGAAAFLDDPGTRSSK